MPTKKKVYIDIPDPLIELNRAKKKQEESLQRGEKKKSDYQKFIRGKVVTTDKKTNSKATEYDTNTVLRYKDELGQVKYLLPSSFRPTGKKQQKPTIISLDLDEKPVRDSQGKILFIETKYKKPEQPRPATPVPVAEEPEQEEPEPEDLEPGPSTGPYSALPAWVRDRLPLIPSDDRKAVVYTEDGVIKENRKGKSSDWSYSNKHIRKELRKNNEDFYYFIPLDEFDQKTAEGMEEEEIGEELLEEIKELKGSGYKKKMHKKSKLSKQEEALMKKLYKAKSTKPVSNGSNTKKPDMKGSGTQDNVTIATKSSKPDQNKKVGSEVYDMREGLPDNYRSYESPYVDYKKNSVPENRKVRSITNPVISRQYTPLDDTVLIARQNKQESLETDRQLSRGKAVIPRGEYIPPHLRFRK